MDTDNIFEELKFKIHHLSNYAWSKKVDWTDVEGWLDNFESDNDIEKDEQIQMLFLLSQTMFFGEREVRELLKSIYRDKYKYKIIEKIRKSKKDTTDLNVIRSIFSLELSATRFLGVGNPSESGTHLLYYFRQENRLQKDLFINTSDIFEFDGVSIQLRDDSIKQYVFLDDLCGSGDQVCKYLKNAINVIKKLNKKVEIYYFAIFGMTEGIKKIKKEINFDLVDCVFELDDSFKCFDSNSRYFTNVTSPITKSKVEKIAKKYGSKLVPCHPLGYNDCQLLLVLNHNTPDNTLPIIWYDEEYVPWQPIFKRFNKQY